MEQVHTAVDITSRYNIHMVFMHDPTQSGLMT